jgi:hypothetical protein
MIRLRTCESDADFEVWLAVRRAVLPTERTARVLPDKRGRGVGSALQAVNAKLGYVPRDSSIAFSRKLPLDA